MKLGTKVPSYSESSRWDSEDFYLRVLTGRHYLTHDFSREFRNVEFHSDLQKMSRN